MALGDDMMEGSISSVIFESLESNQSGDALSPEDLAWVDSCLIKDPEISNSGWNTLKDALLEIFCSEPEAVSFSAARSGASPKVTDIEVHTSSKDAETVQFPGTYEDDDVIVESETNSDSYPIKERNGSLLSQILQSDDIPETVVVDPFLPSYKDGNRESEVVGSGLDSDPLVVEMELLSKDIFKVWDLDVSAEDDELVTQLNKALTETSFQSIPSAFDDSGTWKDMKDESVDNLIADLAALSLNQNPR